MLVAVLHKDQFVLLKMPLWSGAAAVQLPLKALRGTEPAAHTPSPGWAPSTQNAALSIVTGEED